MLIFVHIPKTAGNTLNRLATKSAAGIGVDSETGLKNAAKTWDPNAPVHLVYIGGHFRLSFVEEILAPMQITTPMRYVTLLREPVERAFSLYLFVLRVPVMPHHTEAVAGRGFDYFWDYAYENMHWHLLDAQCYLLCGERSFEGARDVVDNKMDLVGTTEKFPIFYDALRESVPFIGFPPDYSGHMGNVSPKADGKEQLAGGHKPDNWAEYVPAETRRKMERDNAADFALFDYVMNERGGLVVNSPD